MDIYVANGLFSQADRDFNEKLAQAIEELGYSVYLPQRNDSINDKSKSATSVDIYKADAKYIDEAQLLVAVLDGQVMDTGVAAEIGYAAAKGKHILGLYTDIREGSKTANKDKLNLIREVCENQFPYINLFVIGVIKEHGKVCLSVEELIKEIPKIIPIKKKASKKILKDEDLDEWIVEQLDSIALDTDSAKRLAVYLKLKLEGESLEESKAIKELEQALVRLRNNEI